MDIIVSDVLIEIKPLALEKNINMSYSTLSDLPKVLADEDTLKEILVNIVGNAIKYNKSGGTVVITHEIHDGFLTTSVTDNGIGLSKEEKTHLFEKF